MAHIHVDDRPALEAFYPASAFETEASQNDCSSAIAAGLLLLAAAGDDGLFHVERARRHSGESALPGSTIFVTPQLRQAATLFRPEPYSGQSEIGDALLLVGEDETDNYRLFLDEVLRLARETRFRAAIGRGEIRLMGLRGG